MPLLYPLARPATRRQWLLAALLLLATGAARAQAPAWGGALVGNLTQASGYSVTEGVATDASGNVFVTGNFTGTLTFGSTVLTSAGGYDVFVAKYVPATRTWAWATSGGGTDQDYGSGIAVSGTSVYVMANIYNTTANANAVRFGGTSPATSTTQVNGATTRPSSDLLLLKYTDAGSSATLRWTQVGGGEGIDSGYEVAVSGSSVYVAGTFYNGTINDQGVVFGGGGTTAGTIPVRGATSQTSYDMVLAKYTDNGATATLGWAQVGGGTGIDYCQGLAVSGSSVYLAGSIRNTTANANSVVFGGNGTTAGTTQVKGANATDTFDLLLAKYTDNGSSATLGWTQVGGGAGTDYGVGVAVSGTSVYVVGNITNNLTNANAVVFGGGGTTAGTVQVNGASATASSDVVLAKYQDNGATATLRWTQVGGGTGFDYAYSVATSGSSVYLTGVLTNTTANAQNVVFGSSGTAPGTSTVNGVSATSNYDVLLVKFTDSGTTGSYNWAQVGGGAGTDYGYGMAVSGQQVYAAGYATPAATFGPTTLTTPAGNNFAVVAYLTDATLTPLAARPATQVGRAGLALYPNPSSSGAATLTGTAPGAAVQVLDALGRIVATATADATGTAALSGLPAGLYVVRAGAGVVRLSVE